jgi:hypothetical protein
VALPVFLRLFVSTETDSFTQDHAGNNDKLSQKAQSLIRRRLRSHSRAAAPPT